MLEGAHAAPETKADRLETREHTHEILLKAAGLALAFALTAPAAMAAGEQATPPARNGRSPACSAITTTNQLQRGFQVYQNVCSACHTMTKVAFRNLAEKGGPEFKPEQVRELCLQVADPGEGRPERQGRDVRAACALADRFPSPFPNNETAKAANAAPCRRFSVLAKARTYRVGFPAS